MRRKWRSRIGRKSLSCSRSSQSSQHVSFFGTLRRSPGDELGKLQRRRGVRLERPDDHRPCWPFEPPQRVLSQVVDDLRVMRNDYSLPLLRFERIAQELQPGLNLGQGYEVVRL